MYLLFFLTSFTQLQKMVNKSIFHLHLNVEFVFYKMLVVSIFVCQNMCLWSWNYIDEV